MMDEIVFAAAPFVIQLLLCFNIKSRFIRLLPVSVVVSFIVICIWGIAITPPSWERLGYVFLAYYSFLVLAIFGLAWLIWWLLKGRNILAKKQGSKLL